MRIRLSHILKLYDWFTVVIVDTICTTEFVNLIASSKTLLQLKAVPRNIYQLTNKNQHDCHRSIE